MSAFSDDELRFLRDGPTLARLATVTPTGDPHVVPTGWEYNPEHGSIDIAGVALARARNHCDVVRGGRAALVIDDVQPPGQPRTVLIRGFVEVHAELIRIRPDRIVSWGVEAPSSANSAWGASADRPPPARPRTAYEP